MQRITPPSALTAAGFTALALFFGYVAPSTLNMDNVAHAASASRLGDLSRFRTLAMDVAAAISKGDQVSTRQRTTDLESAWDGAEAGIKPRSAADWHRVDKTLDKLYAAVRQDKPDPAACKLALASVLSALDAAEGPSK